MWKYYRKRVITISIYKFIIESTLQLTLEDLVPNALIELIENNVSRSVSYPTILQYGNVVVNELKKQNIDCILQIHRGATSQFEDDYKEIFDFFEINNVRYVKAKDNISSNYLRKHFRIHQSIDTLTALINDTSKQALGINT